MDACLRAEAQTSMDLEKIIKHDEGVVHPYIPFQARPVL
jgi:hypothetical protein